MHTLRKAVDPVELGRMRKADQSLFERKECRQEDHHQLKRDRDLWLEKTIPRGFHEDLSDDGRRCYLEVACCVDCGSLLAWPEFLSEKDLREAIIVKCF